MSNKYETGIKISEASLIKVDAEIEKIDQQVDDKIAKAKEKIAQELQQEYEAALKHFYSDDTIFNKYRGLEIIGEKSVIVQIFEFKPNKELASKRALGQTAILIKSRLNGEWVDSTTAIYEKPYPIVKVLAKGSDVSSRIIPGQIYTVAVSDIEGEDWNPDFLHHMSTFAKSSGNNKAAMVNVPEDMPQKLPKITKNWGGYRFNHPLDVKQEDKHIYCIHDALIKVKVPV